MVHDVLLFQEAYSSSTNSISKLPYFPLAPHGGQQAWYARVPCSNTPIPLTLYQLVTHICASPYSPLTNTYNLTLDLIVPENFEYEMIRDTEVGVMCSFSPRWWLWMAFSTHRCRSGQPRSLRSECVDGYHDSLATIFLDLS